jgi:ectoine hydroxylase-related dioxygenase (phytanoyl-CoA dioxygenase family)
MKALTQQQIDSYRYNGFLSPFPALSPEETAACLAGLQRFESFIGSPVPKADMHWRSLTHACLPFYADLVRNPKILDVVESLIGPDILVWTSTFFIKEANSPTFAAWHQDSTYFGLAPYEQVTAWVALTDASQGAGCIEVLSAHGKPRQMRHVPKKLANSINRTGQTITEPLDDAGVLAMPLEVGQFSLHHTLCVHRSAPNHTPHRRVGLGINYIPAHVRTTGSKRMPAMLVRGTDRYGHFDLYEPPVKELGEKELATHDHVYNCYAENYREQMKRHEQEFA